MLLLGHLPSTELQNFHFWLDCVILDSGDEKSISIDLRHFLKWFLSGDSASYLSSDPPYRFSGERRFWIFIIFRGGGVLDRFWVIGTYVMSRGVKFPTPQNWIKRLWPIKFLSALNGSIIRVLAYIAKNSVRLG